MRRWPHRASGVALQCLTEYPFFLWWIQRMAKVDIDAALQGFEALQNELGAGQNHCLAT